MREILKRYALLICATSLPLWTDTLPITATATDQLFFNVNAGDSGSYSASTPTLWKDLAGTRNGTINGTLTHTSGGTALTFPGNVNSYVDMGSGFENFGSGLTIEFEGHFGTVNQGWERIFDFGNGNEQDNIWVGVLGPYPQSYQGPLRNLPNRLAIEVWNSDLSPKFKPGLCYTSGDELTPNTFDKWVITLDGSTCRIYKNGNQVNVEHWTADTYVTSASGLGVAYPFLPKVVQRTKNYIGKSNWIADPAFDGAIKYVRMYTKALSSTEVTNNYTSHTLTYATTGADSGAAPSPQTGNGLITLAGNSGNMVKAGHTFVGWATTSGASTAIAGSYNLTATTTLHPVWIPTPSAPAISVSRATATSLSVAITPPAINAASVDGYRIETSTNGTTWNLASDAVAAGATSHPITGLTTGSTYYVRAAAKYSGFLSPFAYNWQKIYDVTDPQRTNGAIDYRAGFGTGAGDAATTYASTNFTRVRYRMAATYGGANNYVDADFIRTLSTPAAHSEAFDSLARLRVPSTSTADPAISSPDHFEIHANVSDMTVESNVAGVQNGSGFNGRLEIWPWNYDPQAASGLAARGGATEYDDSDTPLMALSGQLSRSEYGSFQLHRLSSTAAENRTLFAWNRHNDPSCPEIGFGQYSGTHSDWTFAADDGICTSVPRTNFSLLVFIDMPVTLSADPLSISYAAGGGTGNAPSSPVSVAQGSTFTTPANTYARAGYSFAGWNDGAATYAAGASYPASGTVSTPVTLTAQWTANTLNITYDTQGGSSPSGGSSTTVTGGTMPSLPTTTRTGHTFAGWFTAATGGTQITTSSPHGQTTDFTLHAQWTATPTTPTTTTPTAPTLTVPDTVPSPSTMPSPSSSVPLATAPATAAADAPRLTGPRKIQAGRQITLTADGFEPGETVVMSVDGTGTARRLVADADGKVRLTVTLRSDPRSRIVTIRAVGRSATVTQRLEVANSTSNLPVTGGSVSETLSLALMMTVAGAALRRRRTRRMT